MHGIGQAEALLDATLAHEVLNRARYVDESTPIGQLEPEMF